MKLTLKEMNGLLNGKCLPSDLIVGETLAEYLVRKFSDLEQKLAESQREFRAADATIDNLQMQVEKLAAENAGLKDEISNITFMRDDDFFGSTQRAQEVMGRLVNFKTPDNDAFLAEVRAQGVEMFADSLGSPYVERGEECYQDGYTHAIERIKCRKAPEFAAQLRKGVQS
ncbi:hypothetical protein ACVCAJ_23130 [Enterobacter sp. CFEC121]